MKIIQAREMQEGAGVTVYRLFPFQRDALVADPFVLWDDFSIPADAGFPTHAHRGFEAITYLFSGAMNHADNLGNNSTVTNGGAQRFTAGKGIQHSEMPGDDETTQGIQLWINLPQSLKAIEPDYQQVNREDIPEVKSDGVIQRTIIGKDSPLKLETAVEYSDIRIEANKTHTITIDKSMQGLLYVYQGEVTVNDVTVLEKSVALIETGEDKLMIQASRNSRILLALGAPYYEPVKLNGGFVD